MSERVSERVCVCVTMLAATETNLNPVFHDNDHMHMHMCRSHYCVHEVASPESYCAMCEELGTSVGVLLFPVREPEP